MKNKPKNIFHSESSYLVAGGFGGLGRGIIRWMARRGVRYLVILSRSGARSEAAKTLVRELHDQGIAVSTPAVDISDLNSVQEALLALQGDMPPIKGCIQATLALRDNFWPNLSFEDWKVSTDSKVTGSWNLHVALPSDLDFFVLMSSVNGVFGNRGQANYAAGNAFKDALAHHRLDRNLKAVSLDLGLMVDEGRVAEDEKLLQGMVSLIT